VLVLISCAILPLSQAELPPYHPPVDTVMCTSFGAVNARTKRMTVQGGEFRWLSDD
jgi:hypothetical protein